MALALSLPLTADEIERADQSQGEKTAASKAENEAAAASKAGNEEVGPAGQDREDMDEADLDKGEDRLSGQDDVDIPYTPSSPAPFGTPNDDGMELGHVADSSVFVGSLQCPELEPINKIVHKTETREKRGQTIYVTIDIDRPIS